MKYADLSWIDDFWKEAGKYIFFREEDGVLIIPPNRVYKINKSGASLIAYLKNGNKIKNIIISNDNERLKKFELFFKSLSDIFSGKDAPGLTRIQYNFDFTKLPIIGEIALTYRCNNSCVFCYAGCNQNESGRSCMKDISTNEWKKIISVFKNEAKIPFFSFSGGEPLLRDDLEELITYAVKTGLSVNLVSNGTLADKKRAASLYKAGLRTAQISIEAPQSDLHDKLAGRRGAFTETMNGIRALSEAGISVQTNTTITGLNKNSVPQMPAFLKELGINRFAMNMYVPGDGFDESLSVRYDEIGGIVDAVRKEAFIHNLTFYWYSPTPFCYYNPIARGMGNKSCAALDGLVSVAADGSVLPCSSWDEPVGNLLETPFEEIWFSKRASFFKQKQFAPSVCASCSSFTACQGACPLYWRKNGEALLEKMKSPLCKEEAREAVV